MVVTLLKLASYILVYFFLFMFVVVVVLAKVL